MIGCRDRGHVDKPLTVVTMASSAPFQAIVASARRLAFQRGHSQVGTEHLLFQIGCDSPEALPKGLSFSEVRDFIKSAPFFKAIQVKLHVSSLYLSTSLQAVVKLAAELAVDSPARPSHLVAAILLFPRCIARHVLETLSDGSVTARSYASDIGARLKILMPAVTKNLEDRAAAIQKKVTPACPWTSGVVPAGE